MNEQDERVYKRMHEVRAEVLKILSEFVPYEQAAIVYSLTVDPGIVQHMPAVIIEAMKSGSRMRAETCQCADCRSKRGNA